MKDDETRNISLERMELYSLIDSLSMHLKHVCDTVFDMGIEDDTKNENERSYLDQIKLEEQLFERLENLLGE
jgi:hypothetical protein